jgi:hypothetical protein
MISRPGGAMSGGRRRVIFLPKALPRQGMRGG